MTFRETSDGMTVAVIAAASGWYIAVYPWGLRGDPALSAQSGLLLVAGFVTTLMLTIAAIILAIHRPNDANAPSDERHRDVSRRAATRAHFVLIAGAACCFALGYVLTDLATTLNGLLTSIIVAELVRFAAPAVACRTGEGS